MFNSRSPPQQKQTTTGGSTTHKQAPQSINAANALSNSGCSSSSSLSSATSSSSPMQLVSSAANRASSALTLQSQMQPNAATSAHVLLNNVETYKNTNMPAHSHNHGHYHHHHAHHHHHQPHQSVSQQQSHHNSRTSLTPSMSKRGKKNWGNRERSGMSFLIVIAFFAVFGLIILTEVFMIDERSHSSMLTLRQGSNLGGRLGDSMPDYDNVKDDYDLLDDSLLSDNKLGFIQFRDNKLKIQEAGNDGSRYAGVLLNAGGGGGGGGGSFGGGGGAAGLGGNFGVGSGANVPLIPWGQALPTKVEETLPHFPFGTLPTDGSWQVVNGTRFKFFVFSAYYDRRDGSRLVRIVGATKTRGPERVWCRFWYGGNSSSNNNGSNASDANEGAKQQRAKFTSATVMARVKIIRENWNLKYSACFILCPVRTPAVPQYVSVVSRLRAPPGNLLKMRNTDLDADFVAAPNASAPGAPPANAQHPPPTGDNIPDKLAVCVKPFHFNYDQALYLMEYLEFYALLGVSHFTFYNHTMGPHASCVLQHYVDGNVPGNLTAIDWAELRPSAGAQEATQSQTGAANSTHANQRVLKTTNFSKPTVTILPWNLRMRSQKEIRTEGLFAALNDCLYRTMYRYKYLALVDLDEFIVPRYKDTINELITYLNRQFHNRNMGAYSFQNAFYYLQFADDPLASTLDGNEELVRVRSALVTQRKTRRRYKLHPQKQRSKYICKPEAVVEAGNHFVWEFSPGKGSLNVPPKEAILQHYRVCEFGGNDCIKAPSIVDRTTTKYVNRLVQRVDMVYKYLRQRCDLPPLPALPRAQPVKVDVRDRKPIINNEKSQGLVKDKLEVTKVKVKSANQTNTKVNKSNETTKNLTKKDGAAAAAARTKTSTATAILTARTSTTTTTTTRATRKAAIDVNAKAATTNGNGNAKPEVSVTRVRKKRKLVVFEQDDYGEPVARVEYQ